MRCPLCDHEDLDTVDLTSEEEVVAEEASRKWREAHEGMTISEILIESLEAPNPFFKYLASKGKINA